MPGGNKGLSQGQLRLPLQRNMKISLIRRKNRLEVTTVLGYFEAARGIYHYAVLLLIALSPGLTVPLLVPA